MIGTGIRFLDRLTGGLKLGDNVVWQTANAVPVEYFIKSFFYNTPDFDKNIIYINFNYSPHTICKRYDELFKKKNVILIDAFTHGKGNSDPVFLDFYQNSGEYNLGNIICLDKPRDHREFLDTLNAIQLKNRDGSFYIFDCLTGMNELWKNEGEVLDFFTYTCPKLYELNTIAYWIYEKDAHSREFIVGINHITQVVFSVNKSEQDDFELTIQKLEGRPSIGNTGPHAFKVLDHKVHFLERKNDDRFQIGEKVKALRKNRNITQAELSSILGMTPGAISQIENSIVSPSLQTLMQISSVFNRPLEFFLGQGDKEPTKGFAIFKNMIPDNDDSNALSITRLIMDDTLNFRLYSVVIHAGRSYSGSLILHKGIELIVVVQGSVLVRIDHKDHGLEKGDSLLLSAAFVERWENRNDTDCEMIYLLL